MYKEIQTGLSLPSEVTDEFEEFGMKLNRLYRGSKQTGLTNRYEFYSEDTITAKAVGGIWASILSEQLWQPSTDCTRLLPKFRKGKAGSRV